MKSNVQLYTKIFMDWKNEEQCALKNSWIVTFKNVTSKSQWYTLPICLPPTKIRKTRQKISLDAIYGPFLEKKSSEKIIKLS